MCKAVVRWASVLATTLVPMGCFLMPKSLKGKPKAAPQIADSAFVKASRQGADSVSTLDAHLRRIDSLQAPDSAAAELFQLTLENYLAIGPEDPKADEVKLWLGNHLFTRDRFDSAMMIYKGLLAGKLTPQMRKEASQMVAQTYIRMNEADSAQAWFQQQLQDKDSATSKDARDRLAQAMYLQGENAEKEKRFEEAARYYGDVTRAFPQAEVSPIALYNCGALREKLGDWKRALAAYNKFTDAYYQSPLLPRVLFRQAKSREMLGDWAGAADGYWKLSQTYPNSEQAEPALYNAGFAFANAKLSEKSAQAFESYAMRFPQATEAPNLLFKAVELRAEAQQWDKVFDLQTQFQRRYGSDRNRAVQAQCLGGLAAFHQGRLEDARQRLAAAVEGFRTQGQRDPQSRIYAAQAQFTLGEMGADAMEKSPLRESQFDADLDAKTVRLKSAIADYLRVVDYRIADWALRAAHAIGVLFEKYGQAISQVSVSAAKTPAKTLERKIQNLETLGASWVEATEHYAQAQAIALKQGVHDRYSEEAAAKPAQLRQRYAAIVDNLWRQAPRDWPIAGLPASRAVSESMERLAYLGIIASQAVQVGLGFDKDLVIVTDSVRDTSGVARPTHTLPLQLLVDLGRQYRSLLDTVRSAPRPADSMEAFFFQAKLIREGLQPIHKEAVTAYEAGLQVAKDRSLWASPWTDSLRFGLGIALFTQARSLEILGNRALAAPPIPANAPAITRKTLEPKFEEIGYQLQDEAVTGYKDLVARAKKQQVDTLYAQLALLRLFKNQPDAWSAPIQSKPGDTTATSAAPVLLPRQPWDGRDMSPERIAYLKTLDISISHLRP